jgi:xanthine dehydrogenase accessory factor
LKRATEMFRFLAQARSEGRDCSLVTITEVIGSSSRSPGTHLAAAIGGDHVGSVSGGCVEAAVVAEALRVIEAGRAELIRFGVGSPFIDIRLPCGGGLDLLFTPNPDPRLVDEILKRLQGRIPTRLGLSRDGGMRIVDYRDDDPDGWRGDWFVTSHRPDLRIVAVGHGLEVAALARLARAHGAIVEVLTPDRDLMATLDLEGVPAHLLATPAPSRRLVGDNDTAFVFLFHDHDWEGELLAQALKEDSFFLGAMGSRATHAARLHELRRLGCCDDDLRRIVGPIGVIPATRDPDTLALSVLAQVVATHSEVMTRTSNPTADLPPPHSSAA